MEFWAFDEGIATAVIKFPDSIIHLVDAKDLLWFRERDIHTLASHQIYYKSELMEVASMEFTSMVAKIIEKRILMGAREGRM